MTVITVAVTEKIVKKLLFATSSIAPSTQIVSLGTNPSVRKLPLPLVIVLSPVWNAQVTASVLT